MTRFKVSAKMPKIPGRPPSIYSLRPPSVNQKSVLKMARQLRLKAGEDEGTFCSDKSTMGYSEGPYDLTIYRASDAVRFKDRNRWQIDDGKSNLKISDEEAVRVAKGYVGRLKLAPLKEVDLLKVSRLHVAVSGRDGQGAEERTIDAGVCFQRKIGGVPVDGPGGKLIVYLDHEKRMTGFDRTWRSLKGVYREVKKLRPPDYAVNKATKEWERLGAERGEVYAVRFGYFEMGMEHEQRHMQPAYVVLGRLFSNDGRIKMNKVHVVPAAVNNVGKIAPPLRRPTLQKSRKD